jgi:hypothetical protein
MVFVLSLSLSPPAFSRTWDVLADGTGDAPTIQAGIDSAAAGDTVLVHDGIFTGPGNRGLVFGGKAIVLRSVSGPEETVIDCEGVRLEFRHTTVTGNRAFLEGGGIHGGYYYDVPHRGRQSIVWGNCAPFAAEIYDEPWPGFVLELCDVDTSGFTGWGGICLIESICEDPLFCDPADCSNAPTVSGDYSLDAASPCLPAQTGGYRIGVYGQGCDGATGVAEGNDRPDGLFRLRAFPNPFTGEVSLRYSLPETARRPILVYDLRGRVVRTLEASGPAGVSTWDGEDESGRAVPPGVYFARIGSGPGEEIHRIMRVH